MTVMEELFWPVAVIVTLGLIAIGALTLDYRISYLEDRLRQKEVFLQGKIEDLDNRLDGVVETFLRKE